MNALGSQSVRRTNWQICQVYFEKFPPKILESRGKREKCTIRKTSISGAKEFPRLLGNEKGVTEWYTNKYPNAVNYKNENKKNGGYIENRYF